jgi:hypothetical protein
MAKKARKPKAEAFVLDCSVSMAWYFKDEADDYANAVRTSLGTVGAVVPALRPLEVANILVLGERRQRSTEEGLSRSRLRPLRQPAEHQSR